jgi:hypothetical protein
MEGAVATIAAGNKHARRSVHVNPGHAVAGHVTLLVDTGGDEIGQAAQPFARAPERALRTTRASGCVVNANDLTAIVDGPRFEIRKCHHRAGACVQYERRPARPAGNHAAVVDGGSREPALYAAEVVQGDVNATLFLRVDGEPA